MFLLTGDVSEAQSHEDGKNKVKALFDELAQGLKSLWPKTEKQLPRPITRVGRWHS
jgi:hypothetical protein